MDRGAWQATVHGITRVGHDLVTKEREREREREKERDDITSSSHLSQGSHLQERICPVSSHG